MKRNASAKARVDASGLVGRTFLHPAFDYLVIGGGFSLLAIGLLLVTGWNAAGGMDASMPILYLFFNAAHFAASTVRLYTKEGSFEKLPFLTMGLPLVAVAVVLLGLTWPTSVGYAINKIYLTWSPFHYAATAYGLAVMYSYRSGCALPLGEKRLLRVAALLPFVYALTLAELSGSEGWLASREYFAAHPAVFSAVSWTAWTVAVGSFGLPLLLYLRPLARKEKPMPLIAPLLLLSNGIWWIVFTGYVNAFNLATVFHGVQYLAIVTVFHVQDSLRDPGNTRGAVYHAARFYAICFLLAVALFQLWPYAFVLMGFGRTQSAFLVIAIINIHHFIVDAYIWKLKKDKRNFENVVSPVAGASPQGA